MAGYIIVIGLLLSVFIVWHLRYDAGYTDCMDHLITIEQTYGERLAGKFIDPDRYEEAVAALKDCGIKQ